MCTSSQKNSAFSASAPCRSLSSKTWPSFCRRMLTSPHRQPLSMPFSMPIPLGRISPFGDLKCVKCRLRLPSSKRKWRASTPLKAKYFSRNSFLSRQSVTKLLFREPFCAYGETWLAKSSASEAAPTTASKFFHRPFRRPLSTPPITHFT